MPEDVTWSCSECGHEALEEEEDYFSRAGRNYCESCYDELFFICESCGDATWRDDAHVAGNCFYCADCFNESYFYCSECGDAYSYDEGRPYGCNNYCVYCYRGGSDSVNSYDYEPRWEFYGKHGKGVPTFGVETEINTNREWDDCVERINEYGPTNFFYFMEDGSVSNGFEIATMPFTLDWMHKHQNSWNGLFDLRKIGCTSYNARECGTHIHVGKNTFHGRLHQLKFARFFYRNPEFTTEISRRGNGGLDEWATLHEGNLTSTLKNNYGGHKYRAVNVSPSRTIEVRIFRGTLSPIGYFSNVEMVDSVFQFTARNGLRDLTLDKYIPFVYNNKKIYPHFVGSMGSSLESGEVGR